jgi:hypothetical protein
VSRPLSKKLILLTKPKSGSKTPSVMLAALSAYLDTQDRLRKMNHLYGEMTRTLIQSVESGQADFGSHTVRVTVRIIGGRIVKNILVDGQ